MRGLDVGVGRRGPVGHAPLVGVEHLVTFGDGLGRRGVVDVDGQAVALALLGGDDDHTVGSAATVDRGRGGILEHLHGLDVRGVDAVDVVGGDSVYDVEGVVGGVGGRHASHTDGACAAGGSVGHHIHAGELAGHRVHDVSGVLAQGLLHVHHGHGAGEVGLALGGVADNDDFVERCRVFLECDGHRGLGLEGLRLISDV